MGKETFINLFFFVVLKKMSNMFALSIFLHMSTSFEWECFGVFTGTWRISIGDRSLYLASLAWTGLLFRAEIVRLFYVLHFLPVFFQYLGEIKWKKHKKSWPFPKLIFCHQWSLLDWTRMIQALFCVPGPHRGRGGPILGFGGPEGSKIWNFQTGPLLTVRCNFFDLNSL